MAVLGVFLGTGSTVKFCLVRKCSCWAEITLGGGLCFEEETVRFRVGNTGKAKAMDQIRARWRERIRDRFAVGDRLKGRVGGTVSFRVRFSVWMWSRDRFGAICRVTCG